MDGRSQDSVQCYGSWTQLIPYIMWHVSLLPVRYTMQPSGKWLCSWWPWLSPEMFSFSVRQPPVVFLLLMEVTKGAFGHVIYKFGLLRVEYLLQFLRSPYWASFIFKLHRWNAGNISRLSALIMAEILILKIWFDRSSSQAHWSWSLGSRIRRQRPVSPDPHDQQRFF